jgi:hypothetical protein
MTLTGMLRVPRSRGALSGILLVLLGAWGALIPFIGPYFHYAFTPDHSWTYSTARLWLEVLPGVAVLLGGLIAMLASTRPSAVFGSWLAALGGAWFVVGRPLSTLWSTGGVVAGGHPVGGTVASAAENIGFFAGLGAVVIFFAAMALGRFTVIGAREAALAAEEPATTEPATTEPAGRDPVTVPAGGTAVTSTQQAEDQPTTKWRPFAKSQPDTAGATPVGASTESGGKHAAQGTDSTS